MKPKAEFITIKPKTKEAREYFELYMRELHSCKVVGKTEDKVLLNSIAGHYTFWMNIEGDKNWEVIK